MQTDYIQQSNWQTAPKHGKMPHHAKQESTNFPKTKKHLQFQVPGVWYKACSEDAQFWNNFCVKQLIVMAIYLSSCPATVSFFWMSAVLTTWVVSFCSPTFLFAFLCSAPRSFVLTVILACKGCPCVQYKLQFCIQEWCLKLSLLSCHKLTIGSWVQHFSYDLNLLIQFNLQSSLNQNNTKLRHVFLTFKTYCLLIHLCRNVTESI